jgi:hypothetical protein
VSQTFPQFVPAKPSRPPVGVSVNFASAPHFNQAGDRPRSILRLEIRRSLQVHRRLAIGLALVGLALALIYLLNSWSIRTAPSLNQLQPERSSTVEQSSLKRITAMSSQSGFLRTETVSRSAGHDPLAGRQFQSSNRIGNGPGLPGLAAAVVAPWYSADSAVIRNAIVLLLSFVFLGGAIAIVAHRADPRIYIASEVEQLLGFPPMAQLPDFSEVATEITEEHLLRLASGIDLGFRDRGFRRCVLTGTGPEVGVTAVVTRLKQLLETMGRATVVADAAESQDETEGIQGEIILVDAAPLADSVETERLVQSAHCTIVVIESGVTTRAQLRTTANILQRVKAPAVGFVLNRVRLATADPEFRRSIREMGKQLRKQGHATNLQMLQTLEQAIEEGRASLDLDVTTSLNRPAEIPPEKIAANTPLFNKGFQGNQPAPANQTALTVPAAVHGLQLVPPSMSVPVEQAREEIPSPLADIASQFDQLPPEPKVEHNQAPLATPSSPNVNRTSFEPANPAQEKTGRVSLPRLSDLRGMRFSQALRELDHARHPGTPNAGIELLMSAIAPFEPMFTHSEPASAKHDDSPGAAPAEFDLPDSLRAFIPIPESGVSPEASSGVAAEGNGANGNHSHSNSSPPKLGSNEKNLGLGGEEGEQLRPEQKVAGQKLRGPFEQVQILPSRRGQYKKKS